ncbi:hypothetical protein HZB04_02330 [Candidatus Wolfebacteria bacterium]|nr:hypothetical protein [Candidatus Wolfebacteria bacterium]
MEKKDQTICNFVTEIHEEVAISCDRLLSQKIFVNEKEKILFYCKIADRCK